LTLCHETYLYAFQAIPVEPAVFYRVDPGGIDTAVSKQISQPHDVLFNPIKSPGK